MEEDALTISEKTCDNEVPVTEETPIILTQPKDKTELMKKLEGGKVKTIWLQCTIIVPKDFDPATQPDAKVVVTQQHTVFGDIVLADLQTFYAQISNYLRSLIIEEEQGIENHQQPIETP